MNVCWNHNNSTSPDVAVMCCVSLNEGLVDITSDLCLLPSLETELVRKLKLKAPKQFNSISQVLHFIKHRSKIAPAYEPMYFLNPFFLIGIVSLQVRTFYKNNVKRASKGKTIKTLRNENTRRGRWV